MTPKNVIDLHARFGAAIKTGIQQTDTAIQELLAEVLAELHSIPADRTVGDEELRRHGLDPSSPYWLQPREITVAKSASQQRFALAGDLAADHRQDSQVPLVHAVEAEGIADTSGLGPVYRRVPGGDIVVPTGRVLVRFDEHDAAENHRHEFPDAGYLLAQVPSYARHAAWLRAASGSIADALLSAESSPMSSRHR